MAAACGSSEMSSNAIRDSKTKMQCYEPVKLLGEGSFGKVREEEEWWWL